MTKNVQAALVQTLVAVIFSLPLFGTAEYVFGNTSPDPQESSTHGSLVSLAAGRSYTLQPAPSELYPDRSGKMLTDGKRGSTEGIEGRPKLCPEGWVGFDRGQPMITIDLERTYELRRVMVGFLNYPSAGVHPPFSVKLMTSFDGQHWTPGGSLSASEKSMFELEPDGLNTRYVRLLVERKIWVLIDEINLQGVEASDKVRLEPIKKVLVVTGARTPDDESRLRITNMIEGMGLPFDVAEVDKLYDIELPDYQLIIFASSTNFKLDIDEAKEQQIITAIYCGVNVLWIGSGIWGSFKTTDLPDAFGLKYVREEASEVMGARFATFENLAGMADRLMISHDKLWVVQPVKATVEGWYFDESGKRLHFPFITRYQGGQSHGTTTFISLPLLERWKTVEAPHTYARAEILARAVRSLTTDGVVSKHPVSYAREGVFILRLEDYTPGGSYIGHAGRSYLIRMERLLELTKEHDLPLNIAIIPKYNHPFFGESHTWADNDPIITQLRRQAKLAFESGGSLIVHGYDHQNGDQFDDFSGDDWETWDEDKKAFLSYQEQKEITDSAFREIYEKWGIKPTIWETPHYMSNSDTYKAARASGFLYFTESDTKLFPNRNGHLNRANGLLLNVPETAFYFPADAVTVKHSTLVKQKYLLPRLVRLNALFQVFYHNMSSHQHKALQNLLMTAQRFDLWKPNIEEYIQFWEFREQAKVEAYIDRNEHNIVIEVADSFDGLTLAIQLPDGRSPHQLNIDGQIADVKVRRLVGTWSLYPVLDKGRHRIVVTYR